MELIITRIMIISIWNIAHVKCVRVYHANKLYEGWNFNSGNYLFTTDTK